MIKCVEFPDKAFADKSELFAELKRNSETIIDLKKSAVKDSNPSGFILSEKTDTAKALNVEDGYIYAVINTTKYMDSHNDVHLDGIWSRTIKDQQGKVYYLADHDMSLKSVIAFPKDVNMYVQNVSWKDLGVNYNGETQALIFKISKDKIRLQEAKDVINEKINVEHSVRMQYVKVALAINSDEEDYKEEKSNWDKYIGEVSNKERAEQKGYFWAVTEAKVYKEGSMVLSGSNDLTPLLQKDIEPSDDTQEKEAASSTSDNSHVDWLDVIGKTFN